jgi:hypothetical protein
LPLALERPDWSTLLAILERQLVVDPWKRWSDSQLVEWLSQNPTYREAVGALLLGLLFLRGLTTGIASAQRLR